ncbi:hypothetical protein MANY_45700 [Mycolicibacterium anyangense]|jgi:hypothetical protein|uniref:Uncharacterized protein n=1 Tax=Mycolicibacterium anyangense TaxID=1431246 RepID=A0A6N4WFM3_9MYCO|nr:hypothetical protein [Mycolicibacterium anyangense]BBZ79233.1 hypothetical protein MANY_45700 [Mycolicibacterium anyangense]
MKLLVKAAAVAAGIGMATLFGGTAVAFAGSPTTTLTIQDGSSGADGAAIDSDGTQGSYKTAMDGSETGPIMVATPQDKAHATSH